MVVAIYGGSFNPPHVGHLMVSAWLQWTGRCDVVWWVPVLGHAFAKDLVPYDDRIALCQAATRSLPQTEICEIERSLPVPSYTIDTLTALSRRHPEARFRLVVGADVLGETDRWKDWPAIVSSFSPIVVGRQGYRPPEEAHGLRPEPVDFPDISSTEIRRRAASGEPIDSLVPASIASRISELYGSGSRPMLP